MARPLTVLVTAFGPFPGAPFNPTPALLARLARRKRPALAAVRLVTHVFTTSYAAVDAELPDLIARERPEVLLMFGLAARTPFLRIETVARNARSTVFADASGALPAGRAITVGGPARVRGKAAFESLLVACRRARCSARLSHNAGRYLCNYLYWRALAAQPAPRLVLFVHVPALKQGRRPTARVRRPRVTADALDHAADALLRGLAAAARVIR